MKLANLSLAKKVRASKADFMSHMKYYLGIVVALLVVAVFIGAFLGIRADIDYAGGTVITVVSEDVQEEKNFNATKDRIDKILIANNVEVSSYQTEETALGDAIVVKVLNTNSDVNARIKTELYSEFGYDSENLVEKNYVKADVVSPTATNTTNMAAIALSVVIVVIALIMIFRYNLAIAINYFISVLFDIVATLAIALLCRIPVNVSIIATVMVVFAISSITKLLFFKEVNENVKDENLKALNKREHANLADRNIFATLVLILVIAVVALALVAGLGTLQVRSFAIPALVGTIVAGLTTFYLTPYIWTKINIKTRKPAKAKKK